ncbi:unnamed protein product [Amoebophrya sp. A120]|nr:unnamed protein product [Amoebophrya sp. A120]|eukprot:GSA120T00000396001.1
MPAMNSVVVPNMMSHKLPEDMTRSGYNLASSQQTLDFTAKYVTPGEWADLAKSVNASIDKNGIWQNPLGVPLLLMTCGICFCPLVYIGMQVEGKVNADLQDLPVVLALRQRGIEVHWRPKTKFDARGMRLTFSAQTTPVQY